MPRDTQISRPGRFTDSYFRTILMAVSAYTVTATVILYVFEWLPTVVRVPLALPILLFTPGYAVVTAVFPNRRRATSDSYEEAFSNGSGSRTELSVLERCTVAVFTSVVIVSFVALVVNIVLGIRVEAILGGIALITVIASAIGMLREPDTAREASSQMVEDRFDPKDWLRGLTSGMTPVAIILVVLLLSLSGMYLVTGGDNSSPATEFYMMDGDGDEEDVVNGSNQIYRLRVAQHSDTPQNYTVVVIRRDNQSSPTQGSNVSHRLAVTVPPGSTIETTYRANVSESTGGSTLWFLLYRGDAPRSPTPESAHRTLRVSVNETADRALDAQTLDPSRASAALSTQLALVQSHHRYPSVRSSPTVRLVQLDDNPSPRGNFVQVSRLSVSNRCGVSA